MMKTKDKKQSQFAKKVAAVVVAVKIVVTFANVAKKVYDLVPKYETFEGVDGDKLVEKFSA